MTVLDPLRVDGVACMWVANGKTETQAFPPHELEFVRRKADQRKIRTGDKMKLKTGGRVTTVLDPLRRDGVACTWKENG